MVARESTVIEAVVSLAGEMAEHLLDPEDVGRYIDEFEVAMEAVPKGVTQAAVHPMETATVLPALRNRRAILPMVRAYLDLKRQRDAMDFGDQMALAARLARSVPGIGVTERTAVPGGAARRVPGHLGGPAGDAAVAVRGGGRRWRRVA